MAGLAAGVIQHRRWRSAAHNTDFIPYLTQRELGRADSHELPGRWSCGLCGFDNSPLEYTCQLCHGQRMVEPASGLRSKKPAARPVWRPGGGSSVQTQQRRPSQEPIKYSNRAVARTQSVRPRATRAPAPPRGFATPAASSRRPSLSKVAERPSTGATSRCAAVAKTAGRPMTAPSPSPGCRSQVFHSFGRTIPKQTSPRRSATSPLARAAAPAAAPATRSGLDYLPPNYSDPLPLGVELGCFGVGEWGHALSGSGETHELLQRLASACAVMRARGASMGYDHHAEVAAAALVSLRDAVKRVLCGPARSYALTSEEEASVRAVPGGVELAALCGFVEATPKQQPKSQTPRASDEGGDGLVRAGTNAQEEKALLRAIGLTLARAVPTESEMARGPPPSLRAPLMRNPPSFQGLPSAPVRLETGAAMRAERAALEREAKAAQTRPGAGDGDELLRPELMLL